jgi:hypothetical protein
VITVDTARDGVNSEETAWQASIWVGMILGLNLSVSSVLFFNTLLVGGHESHAQ